MTALRVIVDPSSAAMYLALLPADQSSITFCRCSSVQAIGICYPAFMRRQPEASNFVAAVRRDISNPAPCQTGGEETAGSRVSLRASAACAEIVTDHALAPNGPECGCQPRAGRPVSPGGGWGGAPLQH